MKLLTTSKNLIESLNKINIFTSEDVLNHLPFRYEDMSYTDDTFLLDNQKVTILGKLVANPKLAKIPKFDIITFYFVSTKNKFYSVKIFNRSYLMKTLILGEEFTIIGTYNSKKNEIVSSSIVKGKIEQNKALRILEETISFFLELYVPIILKKMK